MNKELKNAIKAEIPVVLDYDGVMFEARWGKQTIDTPDGKATYQHCKGEYLTTAPLPPVQQFVESLDCPVYVLSCVQDSIEHREKIWQIRENYPSITEDNVITVCNSDAKLQVLDYLYETYGGFVYIDDSLDNLLKYEAAYKNDKCKFFHVSSLFAKEDCILTELDLTEIEELFL